MVIGDLMFHNEGDQRRCSKTIGDCLADNGIDRGVRVLEKLVGGLGGSDKS